MPWWRCRPRRRSSSRLFRPCRRSSTAAFSGRAAARRATSASVAFLSASAAITARRGRVASPIAAGQTPAKRRKENRNVKVSHGTRVIDPDDRPTPDHEKGSQPTKRDDEAPDFGTHARRNVVLARDERLRWRPGFARDRAIAREVMQALPSVGGGGSPIGTGGVSGMSGTSGVNGGAGGSSGTGMAGGSATSGGTSGGLDAGGSADAGNVPDAATASHRTDAGLGSGRFRLRLRRRRASCQMDDREMRATAR